MSQELFTWIIGICVLVLAGAMALQGLAGLQILRILKPLILKNRQLIKESKQVVEISKNVTRDAKPGLSSTAGKARELADMAAARFGERKREVAELAYGIRRLGRSPQAKPRRIQTSDGVDSGA
jgi:hypothetical protein